MHTSLSKFRFLRASAMMPFLFPTFWKYRRVQRKIKKTCLTRQGDFIDTKI